jgi:multiple sugar transport system substrate-binding protein
MRRIVIVIALAALVMFAGACTAGGDFQGPATTVATGGTHAPVTLDVWGFYTERELDNFKTVVDGFEKKYPWITINMVPGKEFGDIVRGINAGTPIDVAIDVGPDNVAKLCASGGWVDLNPYIRADNLNFDATFPASVKTYTSFEGKQCALPMLTDAYGLYYNKDLLAKAGFDGPPKTLSQLSSMAEKLTTRNADGSIKTIGFDPLSNFYEGYNIYLGNSWGADWYNDSGTSMFGSDPAWGQMLQWDKQLVDFYGYDNLVQFKASLGGDDSEWNAQQGFETGRVAMAYDGEWREAFIEQHNARINYGTAPFPVADDHPELYGSGLIGGTVVGISRTSEHPAEAWLFTKELTTNTEFLTSLAEKLKNVPTTFDSLKDPTLSSDPIFRTFLNIFKDPDSHFRPLTTLGTGDADLEAAFVEKWEAGKIPDLQAGLDNLAHQIDQQQQLG